MTIEFKKSRLLAEGKTKKIFEVVDQPNLIIGEYKNTITAYDDPTRTKSFASKARYSNLVNCQVFKLLKEAGIPVACRGKISETEFLAEKCLMIPLEIVARRNPVGSYTKRYPHLARPAGEPPHRFHRLVIEFFLKTTKGELVGQIDSEKRILIEGLDPQKGEEDPLIINPFDDDWSLFHSKKSLWDQAANLNKKVEAAKVIGFNPKEKIKTLENLMRDIFLVLEGAWNILGYHLIDLKIEVGLDVDGKIIVADVIDSDSWRLRDEKWEELSKEFFRQGGDLDEVEKKYGLVAHLVEQFRLPKQAVVLWRGSDKDLFPEINSKLALIKKFVDFKEITLSGHKSTQACLNKLEEILRDYPAGGVIITKVGMSNGLGPVLATHTSWPVIAIPAALKDFPDDIWSSLRLPSNTPMIVIAADNNAVDCALNILARSNPSVYMIRQKEVESLDINSI